MAFGATFDLTTLNSLTGYRIDGTFGFGRSLADAGDVNGDGFEDGLVGGFPEARVLSGGGSIGPFNGFYAFSGPHMSGPLGDVNGDGFADFGVVSVLDTGRGPGAVVYFGAATLGAVNSYDLNGASGFIVNWSTDLRFTPTIEGIGDINGDGFDDLFFGAYGGLTSGGGDLIGGEGYVIFGRDGTGGAAFPAVMNIADLDGTNGFRLAGAYIGKSVASMDVNGDGLTDLILGTATNKTVVMFGRDTAIDGDFQADYAVDALGPAEGLLITSNRFRATEVELIGDINGDGFDDLAFGGGGPGSNWVDILFGPGPAGWSGNVTIGTPNGVNGFRIRTTQQEQGFGYSVSRAGDINGDGRDDLIISSHKQDGGAGAAYVVYGRDGATNPFPASFNIQTMTAADGFRIFGGAPYTGYSVSAAGDINRDGVDDLMVSTIGTNNDPSVYIVYGQVSRIAGAAGGTMTGGASHDWMLGGVGNDVLNGLAGDDELDGDDKGDILSGGDGRDRLYGGAGGDVLNGDAGDDQLFGGLDGDKLFGGDGDDVLGGGTGNDRQEGGAGADVLEGHQGNDYLDGGTGDDRLYGNAGNDIFLFQAGENDVAIEFSNDGFDIVRSWRTVSDLYYHIEGLELQGSADLDGTGGDLANNLQGNGGANRLSGLGGVDTINGNDGDDVIVGGAGNDLLRGGLGQDRFVVLQESIAATLETDQVYDFSAAESDFIDLSGIDAKVGGGDDAFTLVGAFTKHAGEMTLTFAGGITTLRLDVNGDGKVDYQMKINGDVTGETGDWLL